MLMAAIFCPVLCFIVYSASLSSVFRHCRFAQAMSHRIDGHSERKRYPVTLVLQNISFKKNADITDLIIVVERADVIQ